MGIAASRSTRRTGLEYSVSSYRAARGSSITTGTLLSFVSLPSTRKAAAKALKERAPRVNQNKPRLSHTAKPPEGGRQEHSDHRELTSSQGTFYVWYLG
jgi:hypothetical protein